MKKTIAQQAAATRAQQQSLWQLTRGAGYNPDTIYSHSTDDQGHHRTIRFECTPTMAAMLEQIAAESPDYRYAKDVVRDFLTHKIHEHLMKAPNPNLQVMLNAEMLVSELNRVNVERETWHNAVQVLKQTGEGLVKDGHKAGLVALLDRYDQDESILDLPSGLKREMQEVLDNLQARVMTMRDSELN